uniref:Uncharacterized protein n=1 Tax=Salix viminalis TaxID=40686 RepID=A0A6N2N301_SALVM
MAQWRSRLLFCGIWRFLRRLARLESTRLPQDYTSTSFHGTLWPTSCSWKLLPVLASLTATGPLICLIPAIFALPRTHWNSWLGG